MAGSEVDPFLSGVQALKDNKLEVAVQLLGNALQKRIERFGEGGPEAAAAYFKYGTALFYRAQEESDIFGASIATTVAASDGVGPSSAAQQRKAPAPQAEGQAGSSGDATATAPDDEGPGGEDGSSEGEDVDSEEEAGGNGPEDEPEDDMQLAWNMLEVARTIYARDEQRFASELADVHILLSDLSTEQERFETALEDLKQALRVLGFVAQENDRRLAELHYKMAITLQSMSRPADALEEVKLAKRVCLGRRKGLEASTDASAAAETKDLDAVLEDLEDKEAELAEADREHRKMKDSLMSAFRQAMGAAPAEAPPGQASGGAGGVIDLGTVGQGKKRIRLEPVAQPNPAVGGASEPAAMPAKSKRTLADLMGGAADGPPQFSFTPSGSAGASGGAEKRQRAELQEHNQQEAGHSEGPAAAGPAAASAPAKPVLPAFLQAGPVQAVYGGLKQGAENVGNEKS